MPMTKINAIILPRPGQSYNPSFEDHQDELGKFFGGKIIIISLEFQVNKSN